MIDDIDFEQYKEYMKYIHDEMIKLCGIPKDLYEKYDIRRKTRNI